MTASRSKSEVLSETAKSYIKQLAKEYYLDYSTELTNKYVKKGIEVENQSIELYNQVFFTSYVKNEERVNKGLLTGECDIIAEDRIIDIKSSWSLDTFPMLAEDINIKDYQAQLDGYMYLYNKPFAEIAYCMVNTPEHLIGYENENIHIVDHMRLTDRVTTISFARNLEREERMLTILDEASKYYHEYFEKLRVKNL
jgi:hypothetical protein